jgi:hypothetical protein
MSAPFHRRSCPRPSSDAAVFNVPFAATATKPSRLSTDGGLGGGGGGELMERGYRALARGSAGGRNRCLYHLRLRFHAKFLTRSGA